MPHQANVPGLSLICRFAQLDASGYNLTLVFRVCRSAFDVLGVPMLSSICCDQRLFAGRLPLVVGLYAAMALPAAHAVGVPGQGAWETSLLARDLDGNAATTEAYYDTVLDVTWLADANYARTTGFDPTGGMDWTTATAWVEGLSVNGVTGWRLPALKPVNGVSFDDTFSAAGDTDSGFNITSVQSELAHLFYVTLGNKADRDVLGNLQSGGGLLNTGPFASFTLGDTVAQYWTGTERPSGRAAWYFSMFGGQQGYNLKFNQYRAWAVHAGDVAAVPEPQAFVMALAGLAVLGALARKRRT
jgi:hypothetical protein